MAAATAGSTAPRPKRPPPNRPSVLRPGAGAGWSLGEAMRTPHFWLLFSVYMFTGLGSFFVSLHQLAFAVDIGFDKLYAAQVLGMGAFLAVPGIVITGTLSDYLGREISAILAYGISILGVVCALFITSPDQHLLLWLHACFFGLTWGARGPAITAKTADLFPGPRLGTILGVITIGSGLGAAIGSWGAGWVHDLTGSYRIAFMLSIASYVCGTAAFWALRRPPVRRPPAQQQPLPDPLVRLGGAVGGRVRRFREPASGASGSARTGRRGSVMRTAVPRPGLVSMRQRAAMRLDEPLGDRQAEARCRHSFSPSRNWPGRRAAGRGRLRPGSCRSRNP